MANQRDKNKRILGVYLERETYQQLNKLAIRKKTNLADLVRTHVVKLVEDIRLTPEEKSVIKKEQQQFEARQKSKLAKARSLQNRLDRYKKDL
jgi:hypothetical protein